MVDREGGGAGASGLKAALAWLLDARTVIAAVVFVAAVLFDLGERAVDAYLAPERAKRALDGYEEMRELATKILVQVNLSACQQEGTPLSDCNLYEISHTGETVRVIPTAPPPDSAEEGP